MLVYKSAMLTARINDNKKEKRRFVTPCQKLSHLVINAQKR